MLQGINWIAVVIAAVVVFLLGYVWYAVLFTAPWTAALVGATLAPALTPGAAMAVGFVNILLITIGLAWLLNRLGARRLDAAVGVSLAVWLFFNFTTMAVDYIYVGLSRDLVLINMGYQLVSYLVTGVILALIRPKAAP